MNRHLRSIFALLAALSLSEYGAFAGVTITVLLLKERAHPRLHAGTVAFARLLRPLDL